MVDLVKIRKKARKGEAAKSEQSSPSEQRAASSEQAAERGQRVASAEQAVGSQQVSASGDQSVPPAVERVEPAVQQTAGGEAAQPSTSKLDRFVSEAGTRREGFVQESGEVAPGEQAEVLTFVVAGEQYGVAIERIVEIVTPRSATRVPNAGVAVVGIISLRGTIVTMIDVRRKLGHPGTEPGADARIVVVERDGETLGFVVDRVLRVVKISAAAIEPPPVVHASEQTEWARGVFRQANSLTILLDLDKLLA